MLLAATSNFSVDDSPIIFIVVELYSNPDAHIEAIARQWCHWKRSEHDIDEGIRQWFSPESSFNEVNELDGK